MIKKFFYFFNKEQKKSISILFIFMLIATALEMLGLGFIFSIVGVLSPANEKSELLMDKLSSFMELEKNEIFLYLLLFF